MSGFLYSSDLPYDVLWIMIITFMLDESIAKSLGEPDFTLACYHASLCGCLHVILLFFFFFNLSCKKRSCNSMYLISSCSRSIVLNDHVKPFRFLLCWYRKIKSSWVHGMCSVWLAICTLLHNNSFTQNSVFCMAHVCLSSCLSYSVGLSFNHIIGRQHSRWRSEGCRMSFCWHWTCILCKLPRFNNAMARYTMWWGGQDQVSLASTPVEPVVCVCDIFSESACNAMMKLIAIPRTSCKIFHFYSNCDLCWLERHDGDRPTNFVEALKCIIEKFCGYFSSGMSSFLIELYLQQ